MVQFIVNMLKGIFCQVTGICILISLPKIDVMQNVDINLSQKKHLFCIMDTKGLIQYKDIALNQNWDIHYIL